ncbi:MAG TPA: type IV pilus modification protein PilV [Pseudomonas sp.]|uniref:type IV pilus modification protein PilV n=1 Tax=Pseudomonas sp. TaxID=306 RepID=UPI002ED8C45A
MAQRQGSRQSGMTLIEVMIALLILSVGVLGVAAVQLNALKYTDSALRNSQASFVAHDMLERIRANPEADYSLASLSYAPTSENHADPRHQDLFDFALNIRQMTGDDGDGRIAVAGNAVSIAIDWSDARGAQENDQMQTFTLNSLVSAGGSGRP